MAVAYAFSFVYYYYSYFKDLTGVYIFLNISGFISTPCVDGWFEHVEY